MTARIQTRTPARPRAQTQAISVVRARAPGNVEGGRRQNAGATVETAMKIGGVGLHRRIETVADARRSTYGSYIYPVLIASYSAFLSML